MEGYSHKSQIYYKSFFIFCTHKFKFFILEISVITLNITLYSSFAIHMVVPYIPLSNTETNQLSFFELM